MDSARIIQKIAGVTGTDTWDWIAASGTGTRLKPREGSFTLSTPRGDAGLCPREPRATDLRQQNYEASMSDKTELITCGDIELVRENVKVVLENIGEGLCGDYDPDDEDDDPLLRFSVYGRRGMEADDFALERGYEGEEWAPFSDGSYCTQISATLPEEKLRALLEELMDEVFDAANQGHSIKKLCERLSWIGNEGLPRPKPYKGLSN